MVHPSFSKWFQFLLVPIPLIMFLKSWCLGMKSASKGNGLEFVESAKAWFFIFYFWDWRDEIIEIDISECWKENQGMVFFEKGMRIEFWITYHWYRAGSLFHQLLVSFVCRRTRASWRYLWRCYCQLRSDLRNVCVWVYLSDRETEKSDHQSFSWDTFRSDQKPYLRPNP